MSGKRAAKISFGLVLDLAERLDAAGVRADCAPSLEEAVDLTWPLAKNLAKLEKTARKAGRTAALARAAVLDNVVAAVTAAAAPQAPVPATVALPGAGAVPQWAEFDAHQWHVELVPGPSGDRDREREAAS